jgi:uncharacterized membrane protein
VGKRTLVPLTTSEWLLMFHITAAFLLVGGSVAAAIFNTLAIRAERPSETAFLLRLVRVVVPVIGIGSIGTLVFGLWLWYERSYSFGATWIWLALALWMVASALGGIGGRHQQRTRELAERLAAEGDTSTAELHALLRDSRGNLMSYLAGAATLGILVLMIWKPGS